MDNETETMTTGGAIIPPKTEVIVEWTDSNRVDDQVSKAYPFSPAFIRTVGTLQKYVEGGIVVTRDLLGDKNDNADFTDTRGTIVIPHENVVSVEELMTRKQHKDILRQEEIERLKEAKREEVVRKEEMEKRDKMRLVHDEQMKLVKQETLQAVEEALNEEIAPHGLSLEDSVWLKRLLNKVFNHNNSTYGTFRERKND